MEPPGMSPPYNSGGYPSPQQQTDQFGYYNDPNQFQQAQQMPQQQNMFGGGQANLPQFSQFAAAK